MPEDSDPESQSESMRECEVPGNNRDDRDFVVGYSSRITIFRFSPLTLSLSLPATAYALQSPVSFALSARMIINFLPPTPPSPFGVNLFLQKEYYEPLYKMWVGCRRRWLTFSGWASHNAASTPIHTARLLPILTKVNESQFQH